MEREAFNTLKHLLCEAVKRPLAIIDPSKGFSLFVDASATAIGAALTQPDGLVEGSLRPVAFASRKLNETHQNWSTLEREAFAALFGIQNYKFGSMGEKPFYTQTTIRFFFLQNLYPKAQN